MSLRLSANKLLAQPGPTGPYPAPSQDLRPLAAVVPLRQSEAPAVLHSAAGPEGSPMFNIPTPQSGQNLTPKRCSLSRISRRLYSRVILGLKLPGRYYFITWTSSPESPPIEKSWRALRKFLKRYRPLACHCYGITNEGNPAKIKNLGVIHMIMRLGKGEERMDVRKIRSHWQKLHKATQIVIKHVPQSQKGNLAAYLSDQRKLKGLGGEMAWQQGIVRWHWSKGWIPAGFTRQFGRVWARWMKTPPEVRDMAIKAWINACHINTDKTKFPPELKMGKKCGSELLTSNIKANVV